MSSISTSNVTSGFIDLATFDEIEKYLYGGPDATAYFVRETRKATWFTQVPVVLSRASGSPAFNQEWSVSISRSGDYLLQTWVRLQTPSITLNTGTGSTLGTAGSLRWTKNFMHNIIRECAITFNDLVAARFDNYHLDFWAAFTVPAGKRNGYQNMIGNVDDLTGAHNASNVSTASHNGLGLTLPSLTLNLPLPFFYGRNSGIALPTAALPYNDMRINFSFRDWRELLILESLPSVPGKENRIAINVPGDITNTPTLNFCQVWANYAIVSNDERKRMACAPRDILIEQVQTAPRQTFVPNQNSAPSFDIRFSHAIKVLFFSVRNTTWYSEWSNYTCSSPFSGGSTFQSQDSVTSVDPILQTSLIYENSQRLSQMGSDYFSLVNPFFHAPVIPNETGYHMYSYSLDFISLDPMASTNFGKLTNVSMVPEASAGAISASNGTFGNGADYKQSFEFVVTAINNNIIRVSGGALGFPVL
jgi:hypothetical protein